MCTNTRLKDINIHIQGIHTCTHHMVYMYRYKRVNEWVGGCVWWVLRSGTEVVSVLDFPLRLPRFIARREPIIFSAFTVCHLLPALRFGSCVGNGNLQKEKVQMQLIENLV